jgi:hypothetical protein
MTEFRTIPLSDIGESPLSAIKVDPAAIKAEVEARYTPKDKPEKKVAKKARAAREARDGA